MPYDSYHGEVRRIGQGRALLDLLETERLQVSCARCERLYVYDRQDLRLFPQGLSTGFFETLMPPKCWGFAKSQPADCPREVVWLDASPEDTGCSDEG